MEIFPISRMDKNGLKKMESNTILASLTAFTSESNMVQQLKALNSKEVKEIYELLEKQFGFNGKLDVIFFLSEKKEKIYIFTRDLEKIDTVNLRIDAMGLYFASWQ